MPTAARDALAVRCLVAGRWGCSRARGRPRAKGGAAGVAPPRADTTCRHSPATIPALATCHSCFAAFPFRTDRTHGPGAVRDATSAPRLARHAAYLTARVES